MIAAAAIFWTLCILATANCQTVDNVKAVLKHLFEERGYNKIVRPVFDQGKPSDIAIDFYLVSIDNFHEVAQTITISGYLYITWIDIELIWNQGIYGGVSSLLLPQETIWKPDIALGNSIKDMKGLGDQNLLINVSSYGYAEWYPYHTFKFKCDVKIEYFPFDVQDCVLRFTAWSSSSKNVMLRTVSKFVQLHNYEENGEWEIVGTNAFAKATDISSIYFRIRLKRRPVFIFLTVIFPLILLGALSIFVFVLPPESGEKVGFSVTVFLSFAVFLTILKDTLPRNAKEISLLSVYIINQMICGTLCVVLTLVQLRLYLRNNDQPINAVLKSLVNCVSRLRCKNKTSCCVNPRTDEGDDVMLKDPIVTWASVCGAMDFMFFWIFLFFQIFLNIYYFATVAVGSVTN